MKSSLGNRLSKKVAVITGSTRGIGYGIAERLAKEGASIVVCSRRQEHVDSAVKKLKSQGFDVTGISCHVANASDRTKLFQLAENTFGGIDILIVSAGVNPSVEGVLDCEESAWDKIFNVNVKASYLLAKEVLPYLKQRKGGKIIFNSSAVVYNPTAYLGAYMVSKTALHGLTKAAAIQLAKQNVQVNCIAPGLIETRFAELLIRNQTDRARHLAMIPLGRFGTPEDVAAVAAFLASDDANYITGEIITVSGGAGGRL